MGMRRFVDPVGAYVSIPHQVFKAAGQVAGFGKGHGLGDDALGIGLMPGQDSCHIVVFAFDAIAQNHDWLARGHPLFQLGRHIFAGVVLLVRDAMPAIAIGDVLNDNGPVRARVLDRFRRDRVHIQRILSVNAPEALDAVGLGFAMQLDLAAGAIDLRAHGVAVVLDDPDHRQIPDGAHIQRFVEITVVGGAIADIGHGDIVFAVIAGFKGDAGRQGQVPADDGVTAPEVVVFRGQVHGAALAAAAAGLLAHHLRHDGLGVHTQDERDAVVAIGGDDMVAFAQRRHRADSAGFVPAVEVQIDAGDALLFVEPMAGFFKLPNQHHLPVPVQEHVFGR